MGADKKFLCDDTLISKIIEVEKIFGLIMLKKSQD